MRPSAAASVFGQAGCALGCAALILSMGACDGTATSWQADPTHRNLKVSISSPTKEVAPGEAFELTLVAENLSGTRSLRDVEVLIPLSRAIDPLRWSSDMGRRQHLKDPPLNLFAWTLDELRPLEQATHKIVVRAVGETQFVAYNAALAFAQGEEGTLLDNGSVNAMPVRPAGHNAEPAIAPLRLRSAGPGAPVKPGESFVIRIHMENLSPTQEAHDLMFTGCLDANIEMAGDPSNTDRDPLDKRFFSWRAPRIKPLSHAVIEMRVRTKPGINLSKTQSVFIIGFLTGSEADDDLHDNWLLIDTPLSAL